MTLARWSLALALVAVAAQADAAGPNKYKPRQCIGDDGQLYSTTASTCPSSMPEVRKKIRSCSLPDGSRAFGDQCPATAKAGEEMDSQALSERSSGLSNADRRGQQRMLQQGRMREASARYRRDYAQREADLEYYLRQQEEAEREDEYNRRVDEDE